MKSRDGAERGVAGDQISPEGEPVNSAGQTTRRPRRSWPDPIAGGRRRLAITGNVGPKPSEANEFAAAVNNQSQQPIAGSYGGRTQTTARGESIPARSDSARAKFKFVRSRHGRRVPPTESLDVRH